jgi:hypothetical protein
VDNAVEPDFSAPFFRQRKVSDHWWSPLAWFEVPPPTDQLHYEKTIEIAGEMWRIFHTDYPDGGTGNATFYGQRVLVPKS